MTPRIIKPRFKNCAEILMTRNKGRDLPQTKLQTLEALTYIRPDLRGEGWNLVVQVYAAGELLDAAGPRAEWSKAFGEQYAQQGDLRAFIQALESLARKAQKTAEEASKYRAAGGAR